MGLLAALTLFLANKAKAAPGYTLTINVVGSGSVTRNPTNPFYPPGANVILTAISNDPTWFFSSWSGDASGTSNPLNTTMDSNKVITATFQQFPTFTLTLATNGQGSISSSPPGGVYVSNTSVTVTATPATGWVFVSWSGGATGSVNPLFVTVNSNLSLTGTFAQLPAFDVQPQGVTNVVGSTVGFSSHAVGAAPLSYQWFFGNSLRPGATNSTLTLTNVSPTDAGNYQVVVTNNYGSATSLLAALVLTNASGSTNVLSVCDEPSLRAAIATGGWVSITCNGTITLANTINITNHVILDGQNVSLTISGGNAVRLFNVAPGAALSATNLLLANGCVSNIPTADGGAIYNDGGTVTLVSCILTNNCVESALISGPSGNSLSRGGAIFSQNGAVSLLGCGIYNNTAGGFYSTAYYGWNAYGGAIYNSNGVVKMVCCGFSSNFCTAINTGSGLAGGAAYGGVVFQASGSLFITNSSFASNGALGGPSGAPNYTDGPGYGGALCINGGGAVVDHSQFTGNAANGGTAAKYPQSGFGGAVYCSGTFLAESCTFAANQALAGNSTETGLETGQGGAIFNAGFATLSRCSIVSNLVQGSAGIWVMFLNDQPGGPALGGGIFNASQLKATNCTFALNSAVGGVGSHQYSSTPNGSALGGGIFNSTNATSILVCVTLASNFCIASGTGFSPSNGLAAGAQIANTNGTLRLHNTIIAYGGTNGNAYGVITDDGFNISSDGSANLLGGSSYNYTDPKLAPLDYYTGPTPCLALLSNSPAIDFGDSSGAPATDQRWYPRPNGDGVDIGAYEFYAPTQAVLVARLNMAASTDTAGLNFTAFPINIYRVQTSSNLMTWSDLETNGPFATVTNISRTFSTQGAGQRYFRLFLQ